MKLPPQGRFRIDNMAIAVFLVAVCARLLHVLAIRESVFFEHLLVDSVDFDARATAFLRGSWSEGGAFYQAPLYPLFLSLLYRIFGHDLLAVRLVQGTLGSASAVLVYLIGRRLYGDGVGLLGAVLAAFTAFSVQQAHFFTVDSMSCLFTVLTVYFSVRAGQSGSWVSFGLAGLATGLATACKISSAFAALLVVLAGLWRWLQVSKPKEPSSTSCSTISLGIIA